MRNALAILTVVVLFSSVASAQLFYPIQDIAINKAGGEQYASGETCTQARAAKYRQHFALMDFDWAAIEAAGLAYAAPVYTLSMVTAPLTAAGDSLEGRSARILISANNTPTVVADGNCQFTNFSWTAPDVNPATTSQYSQTLAMDDPLNPGNWIVDPVNSVGGWPWGDFDGLRNYVGQFNPNQLVFAAPDTRGYVDLHPMWMAQIFSGVGAAGNAVVGIYTFDMGGGVTPHPENGEAYFSEAGQALSPRIDVTPEPASLLLIAVGGIGLLLRKRR